MWKVRLIPTEDITSRLNELRSQILSENANKELIDLRKSVSEISSTIRFE